MQGPQRRQPARHLREQRQGHLPPDEIRIGPIVEVAHPHHKDISSHDSRRPGVAEAVGGAGLAAQGHGAVRRRQHGVLPFQHPQRHIGAFRRQQTDGRGGGQIATQAHRLPEPLIGQHGIEGRQLAHGDLRPAQHQRKTVVFRRTGQLDASPFQETVQTGLGKLLRQDDGRQVAAGLESRMGRKRPPEPPVEIFGIIAAEGTRAVDEQGHGVDQPLLQRQRIDERLEGGAGRTAGAAAVHLPVDGRIMEVGRPGQRADLHVRRAHEHGRRVADAVGASPCRQAGQALLQQPLEIQLDAGRHDALRRGRAGLGQQFRADVRRKEGQPRRGTHPQRRQRGLLRAAVRIFRQQALQPGPRRGKVLPAQGMTLYGILRDDGQRMTFHERQPTGRFVEIDTRGGLYPLDIAAIGRKIEVGFKDLLLAVMAFQQQGRPDLAQLAADVRCRQAQPQTGHLHGDGGTAPAALPAQIGAPGRPQQRGDIDAGMCPEVPVLVTDERLYGLRGDVVQPDPQAESLILRQPHAEDTAVGIRHQPGERHPVQQRGRRQQAQQRVEEQQDAERQTEPCPQAEQKARQAGTQWQAARCGHATVLLNVFRLVLTGRRTGRTPGERPTRDL